MGPAAAESAIEATASARLEALRGLAALQVAAFHALLAVDSSPLPQTGVPQFITVFNGKAAVILFFVLSGLVLGLSLRRSAAPFGYVYRTFALRRLFRIYPAFLVATGLTCGLLVFYPGMANRTPSTWVNDYFPAAFSGMSVFRNLAFVAHDLNQVTWTLRMEMFCSLLLPFLFLAGRWARLAPALLCGVALGGTFLFPTTVSIVVIPTFLIGYLLPSAAGWWRRQLGRPWPAAIAAGAGLLLYLLPRAQGWLLPLTTLLEATGASLLIGTVAYGCRLRVFRILDAGWARFAGRVSFSYYLFHPLALILTCQWLLGGLVARAWPALVIALVLWAVSSALAFPLASLSYHWVEKPFLEASKRRWPHRPPPG